MTCPTTLLSLLFRTQLTSFYRSASVIDSESARQWTRSPYGGLRLDSSHRHVRHVSPVMSIPFFPVILPAWNDVQSIPTGINNNHTPRTVGTDSSTARSRLFFPHESPALASASSHFKKRLCVHTHTHIKPGDHNVIPHEPAGKIKSRNHLRQNMPWSGKRSEPNITYDDTPCRANPHADFGV